MHAARRAAEAAARESYGRLIAIIAARSGDIAGAEDALSEAFAAALATWADDGVPDNPEAWLLVAARRRLHNQFRHTEVQNRSRADLLLGIDERQLDPQASGSLVDERLKLLFVCAHPAIEPGMRTPLMLQVVLGLSAERIGSAFLIAPKTIGQRLVRVKSKIKLAGLGFAVPSTDQLPERLDDVLAAIYAAYGTAWDDLDGSVGRGLVEEALYLGRLITGLLPQEPETYGLLALMLYCESRRLARRDLQGRFVPLAKQDPQRWSSELIGQAEHLLATAATFGKFGRFACEAAIQSVHAQRAVTGVTAHAPLRVLYDLLLSKAPSIGVAVARAAALLDAGDISAAQTAFAALEAEQVAGYQPYWVTRARLAELTGDARAKHTFLERALGLTESLAVRRFLSDQLQRTP